MRSKCDIERTLAHLKTDCTGAPEINAHWIEALEWVLGDAEHRKAYEAWLHYIDPAAKDSIMPPGELIVRLFMALERLR